MPPKKKTGLGRPPEKRVVKSNAGSAKARKTAARLGAVQVLYQMRLNNQDAKSALREFIDTRVGFELDGEKFVPADTELLESIIKGVAARWADVDAALARALADGRKGDPESLLDSILRAGIYELMADGKTDAGIIINDYLNVTTGFYDGSEPKIVNAILDKVAKAVRD
ncbi:MAG: transcription antitermination factor NusB [Alphaproteobacteria bacterium]|nr:transcription antitermination factor NusB [Alphaproteobacteria bacterium]MDE2336892.1 transcription antitermination factor NusB [Alphaproteobacteria bacterium]